jgi:hypothetical protein
LALSREQQKVLNTIVRVGRRRGAPRKHIKAAIETGLVEANLTNPRGGHGTSVGWRQEINTYGSVARRRNVAGAARRFFQEAKQKDRPGLPSGTLAQAVQRSAYPGRYAQRAGEAGRLLRSSGGGGGGGGSRASKGTRRIPGKSNAALRQQVAATYFAERGRPGALLRLSEGLKGAKDVPGRTVTSKGGRRVPGGSKKGSLGGGDQTKRVVQLSRLAHKYGLKTTSGKRGTVRTKSGGVSDHFVGNRLANARDLSGSPAQMKKAAQAIARQLGVRYKPGVTNVVKGGYRYQLIHQTNVGGNHWDHVHVGVKRVK